MDSTSRAIVVQAALYACLLSASATAAAQATFDCQGCTRSVFSCGGEVTGDLSPEDCSQGDRFVDLWILDPGSVEAEIRIEAVGFTPRLSSLASPSRGTVRAGRTSHRAKRSPRARPASPPRRRLRA